MLDTVNQTLNNPETKILDSKHKNQMVLAIIVPAFDSDLTHFWSFGYIGKKFARWQKVIEFSRNLIAFNQGKCD